MSIQFPTLAQVLKQIADMWMILTSSKFYDLVL